MMAEKCYHLKCMVQDASDFVGKTLDRVTGLEQYSEEIRFFTTSGEEYLMYHYQDCCETVSVEDVECDIEDFKGAIVLSFEEASEDGDSKWGTYTWTFYTIDTTKGRIWLRWNGESNGYYSESVNFVKISTQDENQ